MMSTRHRGGYLYRQLLKKGTLPASQPDGHGKPIEKCPDGKRYHWQEVFCPTCRATFTKTWWVKYYVNGNARRESTRCTKKGDAQRFLALRLGAKAAGDPLPQRLDRIRYQDLSQDLKTHYQVTGCRDAKESGYRLHHLDAFFGNDYAVGITPPRAAKYIQHRQTEGVSNRTINIELSVLKRMLNLAYRNGKLARVPHFDRLTEAPPRSGFFEASQFECLLEHLPSYLRAPMTFAYITGWRVQSEVLTLQWSQVDFPGGVIRLEPGMGKTGEPRTFPLTPELRSLLEAQGAEAMQLVTAGKNCLWVFHRDGQPIKYIRRAWRTACKRAELEGRIPHDFRRTAVRNMVRAGIPERVAMQLTGHKTRSVFDRYNIVSPGDLEEAGRKLSGQASGYISVTPGQSGE